MDGYEEISPMQTFTAAVGLLLISIGYRLAMNAAMCFAAMAQHQRSFMTIAGSGMLARVIGPRCLTRQKDVGQFNVRKRVL